jgi:hypothetical protein
MADYINIYGQDILAVASDPANPTLGQIWYNTTSNTLKGGNLNQGCKELKLLLLEEVLGEYDGTNWTAGGTMSTARGGLSGAGIQTAALAFGGFITAATGATEEYDGSTWTAGGKFINSKIWNRWSRYSNSSFSFWWKYFILLQEQQKNIMVQLGLLEDH